jgi:hypothetical protein
MIQYLYLYLNYPACKSRIFLYYIIACVAMLQSFQLSCKCHDFQKENYIKQKMNF